MVNYDDRWSEMLPDVLEYISDRLPLREFVTFRGVCRSWRSALSGRSGITNFSKDAPWIIFYQGFHHQDSDAAACYLYNCHLPTPPSWCIFRLPHLRGATVTQSKSGWLFARRGGHFFLYNPFTLTKIDLPDHRVYEDQVCAMSSTITATSSASSATVCCFIVSRKDESSMEVSLCHIGDSEWKSHAMQISKDKLGGTMSAVFEVREEDRRRRILYIFGPGYKYMLYDYTKKTYLFGTCISTEKASAEITKIVFQFAKDTYHDKNWLQMFGEDQEEEGEGEGITVSTCPLSIRPQHSMGPPHFTGFGSRTRVVAARQEDDDGSSSSNANANANANAHAQLKSLKASWIEPKFT